MAELVLALDVPHGAAEAAAAGAAAFGEFLEEAQCAGS